MRRPSMVWLNNFLALAVLGFGVWWLIIHMPEIADSRLLSGLAGMICFVVNHFRWWRLTAALADQDLANRIDFLITIHYLAAILAFGLVDFRH